MAGQDNNQNTPNSRDSGGEGEKLIFGKYKTMEEAEKAHKNLEKEFHESREFVKKIDERFDALESRFAPQDDGYQRGYAPAPRATPPQQQQSTETLTRFYQNPDQVFNEVEERAARRIRAEQEAVSRNNMVVNDWLSKNQDVAAYPELLTYWVGQQDQRLGATKKLDEAAKIVRQRIVAIKGDGRTAAEPNPGEIIEGPGSTHQGNQPAPAAAASAEGQLSSYVAQRNASARKPLGVKR